MRKVLSSSAATPIWRPGNPWSELQKVWSRGGILAVPTESSYGLAVDPRNPEAVSRVYEVKGRAGDLALPVLAADFAQIRDLGIDVARPELVALRGIWPAPLTVVAPVASPIAAAPGRSTLAVRIPAHPLLRSLLTHLGPMTGTSANRSGEAPMLDPREVADWLGSFRLSGVQRGGVGDVLVVDGEPLGGGPPSTLVAWERGWKILRPGAFAAEALPEVPSRVESAGADDPSGV